MERKEIRSELTSQCIHLFIYPSAVAALLESEFSPVTSSSNGSFFNGSSELRSFSGSAMACSKGCSADEQTPMARASGVLALGGAL